MQYSKKLLLLIYYIEEITNETIINLMENIINNLSELIIDVENKLLEISEIKFNLQGNEK